MLKSHAENVVFRCQQQGKQIPTWGIGGNRPTGERDAEMGVNERKNKAQDVGGRPT